MADDAAAAAGAERPFKPNPKELDGVGDLASLVYMEEPHILHNLKCRFAKDEIYCSLATVLVAVNPYKRLSIYEEDDMDTYAYMQSSLRFRLPPHIFSIAEAAYRNVVLNGENQSLIVSGESGSGKTESAKLLMRHLASTTQKEHGFEKLFDGEGKGEEEETKAVVANGDGQATNVLLLEQQVLCANPILESFGNAKTIMNNNSSRFGKFTKLIFSRRGRIVGSYIETYLLERSRVVRHSKGERTFHIFYQLLRGAPLDMLQELYLTGDFHYIKQSRGDSKGVADKGRFVELQEAFTTLQVSQDLQRWVFRMVAGIMHLGNVTFEEDSKSFAQVVELSIAEDPQPRARARQGRRRSSIIAPPPAGAADDGKTAMGPVDIAAKLFGVEAADLGKRLVTKTLSVGRETVQKALTTEEAVYNRDAIAKATYDGLFKWIVARINEELFPEDLDIDDADDAADDDDEGSRLHWIGILDIFGFEMFENNSFEQLCINFANETIQAYFNEYIIKSEQEEYLREAVPWTPIEIPDGDLTLSLIDAKPMGIRHLIDSACLMPQGDDQHFTDNLFRQHKDHPRLRRVQRIKDGKGKQQRVINGFAIQHYAAEVVYNADGFLVKNADSTHPDTVKLFQSSVFSHTRDLLSEGDESDSAKRTRKTFQSVSSVFSRQLTSLMRMLKATRPFFVRCVNPNDRKKAGLFDDEYVLPQLRSGGLMEAVRVLKLGYPTRAPYERIHARYGGVLKERPNVNERDFVEAILFAFELNRDDFQLGLTKVFFRPNKAEAMEAILKDGAMTDEVLAKIYAHLLRKRMLRLKGFARALGRWTVRMNRIRAVTLLQRAGRVAKLLASFRTRIHGIRVRASAVTLQSCVRAASAHRFLRDWMLKKEAGAFILDWLRRQIRRRALCAEIESRINAKRTEERQRQLEEEKRLAEEKRRQEAEERARLAAEKAARATFHPTTADAKQPSAVVQELGHWIAQTLGVDIHGDLFAWMADGVHLCQLIGKIRTSVTVTARAGGKFHTKSNLKKFLDAAKTHLGVPVAALFQPEDLMNYEEGAGEPTPVVACLLHVAYSASALYGNTKQVPQLVEEQVEATAGDHSKALAASIEAFFAVGTSGGDDNGGGDDDDQKEDVAGGGARTTSEDKNKSSKKKKKKKKTKRAKGSDDDDDDGSGVSASESSSGSDDDDDDSDSDGVEQEERKEDKKKRKTKEKKRSRKTDRRSSAVNVGLPDAPAAATEARDQNEAFFLMTTAAVLRRLEEDGVIDPREWSNFDGREMYRVALEDQVAWHKWSAWIRERILKSLMISNMTNNAISPREATMHPIHRQSVSAPNGMTVADANTTCGGDEGSASNADWWTSIASPTTTPISEEKKMRMSSGAVRRGRATTTARTTRSGGPPPPSSSAPRVQNMGADEWEDFLRFQPKHKRSNTHNPPAPPRHPPPANQPHVQRQQSHSRTMSAAPLLKLGPRPPSEAPPPTARKVGSRPPPPPPTGRPVSHPARLHHPSPQQQQQQQQRAKQRQLQLFQTFWFQQQQLHPELQRVNLRELPREQLAKVEAQFVRWQKQEEAARGRARTQMLPNNQPARQQRHLPPGYQGQVLSRKRQQQMRQQRGSNNEDKDECNIM